MKEFLFVPDRFFKKRGKGRVFAFLFISFFLFFSLSFSVFLQKTSDFSHAIDFPYIVIGENVWLLKRDTGTRLFLLPETYYARVDNLDEEYYYVTFNGVAGKVDRTIVSSIGYHTDAPGTITELRIDPKYASFTEIRLKGSMDGGVADATAPVSGSFLFLGKYPTDTDLWYYVRYEDVCGYVKSEFTTLPDLVLSPFVPEEREESDSPEPISENEPENNVDLVKILVISGLSVAAVVLLIVLFFPRKKGAHKYYYEDVGDR